MLKHRQKESYGLSAYEDFQTFVQKICQTICFQNAFIKAIGKHIFRKESECFFFLLPQLISVIIGKPCKVCIKMKVPLSAMNHILSIDFFTGIKFKQQFLFACPFKSCLIDLKQVCW